MAATPSEVESISDDTSTGITTNILFCGSDLSNDESKILFNHLGIQSKDKRFPILATFLSRCTDVLKQEVALLSQNDRLCIPHIQNIPALADLYYASSPGRLSGAFDSALNCALQLGLFIGYQESHADEVSDPAFSFALAGLSVGLLSAAAIATSASWVDVANAGPESVRVAFRLGIQVEKTSQTLEQTDSEGQRLSWAYVITEMELSEVQKELDQLEGDQNNSKLNRVFVSAADKTSVSVTGPPSQLRKAFLSSQRLRYSKHSSLSVYGGLCHAPHVYGKKDVHWIVHGSPAATNHSRYVRLPLFSTRNGEPFKAETTGQLLEEIISEILTGTIYLDNLSKGLGNAVSHSVCCSFMQFGSSPVSKSITSNIEAACTQLALKREDLTTWVTTTSHCSRTSSRSNAKLAIVGMSCRLPGGANNNELFWKLMMECRDVHTVIPADRFDVSTHFDPTGKTPNASETPFGNFIDEPGKFDAGFFNMSPLEAEQTDPMHRLALVTAYEALEMAGYSPYRTPSTNPKRVGTFYGQASDDWREVNAGQNIGTYAVPGGERAFANGRINYFFKFGGPSFNIDTACSSGLAAVQAACSSLWLGETDMALAGGLNIITNPDNYSMLSRSHFLSKTGQCKVWDQTADGYCRADGVGSVVIKRLEDAEADNDNVIAVISGGATNHSAEAASVTQPHAGAQMENYRQVIQQAGVSPLDVTYVELHGTGTQVGDAIESESVAAVFSPLSPPTMRRRRDQRLHLGAVKTNIGHAEAAAGIASLIKALLVYQKNQIPPQVPFATVMNPTVEKHLARRHMGLVMEATPWLKPQAGNKKRYALVNSFGAHGGNTTILLEDAPERPRAGFDPRSNLPFFVSAKSKTSLRNNIEALLGFFQSNETSLADVSYTLSARRIHHYLRVGGVASSVAEMQKTLKSSLDKLNGLKSVNSGTGGVVLVFTGQGSFYQGVGSQLYHTFPPFRDEIQMLDALTQKLGFPSVVSYVESYVVPEGDSSRLSPVSSQLAVLLVELALTQFWQLMGVTPSAVIGHSLGEYAALVAAGVLSAADAIYLVGKRAQLIESKCELYSHVMLSVKASVDNIAEKVGSEYPYDVSCVNGAESTVISGPLNSIDCIRTMLKAEGIATVLLEVPMAFHSRQVDSITEEFEKAACLVTFKPPKVPIISPLLKDCIYDGQTINARYLAQAFRQPVHFLGALEAAAELEVVNDSTVWLEIGPNSTCTGFIKSWMPHAKAFGSLQRRDDDTATIGSSLASLHCCGVPVLLNEYFRPYERSYKMVSLESYQWNVKNYWIQYEGTWCLDKAFPTKVTKDVSGTNAGQSSWSTSSLHQVTLDITDKCCGTLVATSNLKSPSLLQSVHGHQMNGYGVATTSIWADMALSVGEYLYRQATKTSLEAQREIHMNVFNMEVHHAQIISRNLDEHLIRTEAEFDSASNKTFVRFYSPASSDPHESFATCTILYEDPTLWSQEWTRMTHLVQGRIDELRRLSHIGVANSLNRNMAYTLFKNVVDYADEYRGMQSVIMADLEAFAEVTLAGQTHGNWHSAPHYIDSVCHIGGLVLNGSDVSNTRDYFYVTPGWGSFRMAHRMEPGAKYQSYTRMLPTTEANMFAGDIYILQNGKIVGMMGEMKFRRVPRLLMGRFFSPLDDAVNPSPAPATESSRAIQKVDVYSRDTEVRPQKASTIPLTPVASTGGERQTHDFDKMEKMIPKEEPISSALLKSSTNSTVTEALELICRESGQELSSLNDDALFVELGIDSLMSLVLSEKFRTELKLEVNSSMFIQCSNIREFKEWLEDYC